MLLCRSAVRSIKYLPWGPIDRRCFKQCLYNARVVNGNILIIREFCILFEEYLKGFFFQVYLCKPSPSSRFSIPADNPQIDHYVLQYHYGIVRCCCSALYAQLSYQRFKRPVQTDNRLHRSISAASFTDLVGQRSILKIGSTIQ